jgi:hypothetical protein
MRTGVPEASSMSGIASPLNDSDNSDRAGPRARTAAQHRQVGQRLRDDAVRPLRAERREEALGFRIEAQAQVAQAKAGAGGPAVADSPAGNPCT